MSRKKRFDKAMFPAGDDHWTGGMIDYDGFDTVMLDGYFTDAQLAQIIVALREAKKEPEASGDHGEAQW